MNDKGLLKALRRLKVETGSLACMGCGYEHNYGYLDVCPLEVSAAHRDADGGCAIYDRLCPDCRREFWMQEVE